ncbi:hypothetical protein [Photorhabdus khanii]|uniref:Uncharacterized protein n=1 Tax=Photorhabdus khanii subsp. guanajuatensis TaxID=2100166 RepID=A0A4R4JVI0_9GAMM|nr:hypothetical protein [Photorhabdus khanii]TDB57871.1 hypothetical protein C5467_10815 [Photorhabdus khanii subsp. guanajuatensis]
MHIITFIVVLLASLGALYVGAKVFAFSFIALAKVFQHIGLFLWNKFAAPAMRSVQAVIKERAAKAEQAKVAVEPEVTQVQEVAKQEPDWDYLEIPTYLRKGKDLVW